MKLKPQDRARIKDLSIVLGVGVGAFAVYKLLQEFGIFDTKEERKEKKEVQKAETELRKSKAYEETKACSAAKQSKPDPYWANVADQIHESLKYSAVSDNKEQAERLLKMPVNDCDTLSLLRLYGKRQLYFFGFPDGEPKSLAQTVTSELSTSRINNINKYYASKGITLRF